MAKKLNEELERIKTLNPEDRLARLNSIKRQLEEETKQSEQNIEALKKKSQDEIILDEERNLTELLKKEQEEEKFLENTVQKEELPNDPVPAQYGDPAERIGEMPVTYEQASDYVPANEAEALSDQATPEQTFEDKKKEEVDVNKKVLDDLNLYRAY